MRRRLGAAVVLVASVFAASFAWAASEAVIGNVRIQTLSPTLVRVEQKGPRGFEDRVTFTVVDRAWPGVPCKVVGGVVTTDHYVVRVPKDGENLAGTRVELPDGTALYTFDGKLPPPSFLPSPARMPEAFVVADAARIVPPLREDASDPHSGWDVGNDAPDLYIFIPGQGGYEQLRRDFLKLTGPVPLPPLYTFGLMHSRFHPYSDRDALEVIDTYRKKRIPLDVFVVDTDWRVGASHGYGVNTNLFPDMAGFLRNAHKRGVRVMYNDHPEPIGAALDPKELRYRYDGLTSLLKMGADVWWFDRNWHTHLNEPAPGIRKEVWGMRLYHDITQRFRPEQRPLIMSNVQGIDNGRRKYPSHPAAHRYPIWWTGDTAANWDFLRLGVVNGVDSGVVSLLPYVSEDLSGHVGRPTAELYVRFLQYGALSPIMRLHCTRNQTRDPWAFGAEAERIVTEYARLRYRLLPTFYAAARRAYDDGTPLLRRCDLYWPEFAESADSQQYLLGDDILVAPILSSTSGVCHVISGDFLRTPEGKPGLRGEYFANTNLTGTATVTRTDAKIDFHWDENEAPAPTLPADYFSARWKGRLGPVPETGEYKLQVRTDDGTRLWLDGKLLLESWVGQPETPYDVNVRLEKGKTYDLRIDYFELNFTAACVLEWKLPSQRDAIPTRTIWIPPGEWLDAWTGARVAGPKKIEATSPLWHTPMYARAGGIVLSTGEAQHTGERPWDTIVVDAFLPADQAGRTERTLYEDDGISPKYQQGASVATPVVLETFPNAAILVAGKMQGDFDARLKSRAWVFRLHLPKGRRLAGAKLNDADVTARVLRAAGDAGAMPFRGQGAHPGLQAGDVVEVRVAARPTSEPLSLTVTFQ